ncbi:RNA polymerase sigma factor [Paenibacillus albus]|uniref:RNA polymerase sigma factor n=1 Tax=Paenibacillus albus TaxID=2495582 RepID=A0A3Q8X2P3_9BACL|nr:RNA polymerase sigma factor [Paenibacillus albus]AZN39063.1 RNA polymerase sigma factor [Paenibacillus albus]
MESSQQRQDEQQIERLVASVQQGHTGQYADLVRIFQQPIFRYCYRLLTDKQDAEDAVQDILVKAYQSLHQYKRAENFSAWLYRIAHRHCLNLLRRRRLHQQVMRFMRLELITPGPEAELGSELFNHNPALAAALALLSSEERSLLILRVFEEKSYEELSDIMQARPNALIKRMQRIKQKVQQVMRAEEGTVKWSEPNHLPMNSEI